MKQVEEIFCDFILNSQSKQRTLPVMKTDDRRLCHELAEHYGLKTESVDPEPARSVVIYRTEWGLRIPKPLLSEVLAGTAKQ